MAAHRLKRVVAVGLAILAVLVVVLLLPPVQTALVRAMAGRVDGTDIEIGRVSAGPWGGAIEGLELQRPGLSVSVERADADIAFWSSLGHLTLDIERASLRGVDIHVGPFVAKEDDEAAEPLEFHGLAPLARVPRRVVVRSAQADGSITVTGTDTLELTGPWSVRASNLGPNRRLAGHLESTLEARGGGDAVLAAVVNTSLTADIDAAGVMREISAGGGIESLADDPVGLDAGLELQLADDAESYVVQIDGSGGHRLLTASGRFAPSPRVLDATWEVRLTPGLIAAFADDHTFPELWGRSNGTAALDLDHGRLELDTSSRFEGRNLGIFDPRLADVTDQVVEADVVATLDNGTLAARRLRIALIPSDGEEILRLEALQPVTLDLETWDAVPANWGESALRIEMDRFPLRWTRGFDPAVVVENGEVSAALDVVPMAPRHAVVVTHEPVRARGLQFAAGDLGVRPPLLDVTIVPRMEIEGGRLEAEITSFEMVSEVGGRVSFSGGASTSREDWPVIGLNGAVAMRLPRLQAAVNSLDALRGRAVFDLDLKAMTLGLDSAVFGATDAAMRPLVKIELVNETPLEIGLPSLVADWESSSVQRMSVRFDGLPIGWISPFVPELEFEEGDLYGELEAVVGGGHGLTLSPAEPFQIRGLKPIYRGIVVSKDATVSLEPHVRLDNTIAEISLDAISVRTRNRGRLDGHVTLRAPRDGRRRIDTTLWFEGDFPNITERIGRIGALSWHQECVIDVPKRRVEVREVDLGLTDLAGTRFLELEALRPFILAAEPFGVWVDGGSPDILVATVTPLELQQLFPTVFGFELEGVLPQGQFLGRAENGGLLLLAEDELVFNDVNVRWQEAALLDRVTVGLTYEVLYSADGLQARTIDFSTLGPRGTPIADATLRAVMPLTDRTTIESLTFETVANLEPLTRQPVFDGLPDFLEGTIGGSMDLTYGEDSSVRADLHLRGARAEGVGALPDADGELEIEAAGDERLTVWAPMKLRSDNGTSDLSFRGGVERVGEALRFDAELNGDRVVVSDVTRLVHVVAPPEEQSSAVERREQAESEFRKRWSKDAIEQLRQRRDETPFWGENVSGTARLHLGFVQFPRYTLNGVSGRLSVDPGAVEVDDVAAELLGARLEAGGALTFDGSAELPYDLRFASTFIDLDLGQLFREVEPDAPPILEGIFEVRTSAAGQGRNAADLGLGTLGEVRVSGRDGVFRGMAGQYTWARRGAKVVGVLTFSKQLKAVSRLLGELEALDFDTFDVVLARETPKRFSVSEMTVVSPLARIEGSGGVEVEPGVPLVESPLDVSLDLATQGDMTILFNGLGLLEEGTETHGYRPLTRPVTVGGTVAEPDTTDFYEMLDQAATDSKGVLGVGMRRVNKKLQKAKKAKEP